MLAAGGSNRFGESKLLLPWHGTSIVKHVAEKIAAAGFDQFIVVLGSESERVKVQLSSLSCEFVMNPIWSNGQGGSVALGVKKLKNFIDAVMLFVGDQPLLSLELIKAICNAGEQYPEEIIVPGTEFVHGNPVYFNATTFESLSKLQADIGGRSIFKQHSLRLYEWKHTEVFQDIDTPEDYKKLVEKNNG